MAANRKIFLSGDPEGRYEEAIVSGGEMLPGMCGELVSDGTLKPNDTAGAAKPQRIVVEQLNTLKGGTVDDAYEVGDLCSFVVPQPGDHFNLLLSAGENVTKGDILISQNDGTFIKDTGTPQRRCWEAQETLDLSGGGAVDTLIAAMYF
jgi:hypothetical protein